MDTPAKRIQWALEQRGMGVRELARRLGVSPGLPSQWWRTGGRATSPASHLDRISEILEVNVDWLRYGRGEPFRSLARNLQEIGAPLDTMISKTNHCARFGGGFNLSDQSARSKSAVDYPSQSKGCAVSVVIADPKK